jgi:alpha-galactosidase
MGVRINPELLDEPKLFVQVRATPVSGIDPEPSLLNIRGSGNTITLIFSEPMNPASAVNPDNYRVARDGVELAITGATLNQGGGGVTLTLASPLGIDTAYTVGVDGVTSGSGQSLGATTRPFRTWDDDPDGIQVFILAGQSNMVGRGESELGNGGVNGAVGSLRHQVVNDSANYAQLVVNPGTPATSPWVIRNDVKFWWNRADVGAGPSISKGGLNPRGFGSGPSTFGPEYGFGWAVGDRLSQPVLLVKTAWGGKDLVTNFRSPGAVAARGGVVGAYYIELIEQVREVLHQLQGEFPAAQHPEFAAVGYRYRIAGFGWHQGWNDGLNSFAAGEYEANMANFITDIRAEFGKPALPFSIGTTGMAGPTTSGDLLKVVNAQLNVANPALHQELGGHVFTVDTRPFAETTENSPTNDTTHWKNNGKSMYRIGKGMGDGIADLLGP